MQVRKQQLELDMEQQTPISTYERVKFSVLVVSRFSECAQYACTQSLQLCPTLCDPMHYAHQGPLSIGFPRQEYWSGISSSRRAS